MKFSLGPDLIELKGDTGVLPTPISYHQLQKLLLGGQAAHFFSLRAFDTHIPHPSDPYQLTHPNPTVQQLLLHYEALFAEPTHMPPPRFSDHPIPLLPNSAPVNVRPYRYPHTHKIEIESQVSKLLANGWI